MEERSSCLDVWTRIIHNKALNVSDLGTLAKLFLFVQEGSEVFMLPDDWAKDLRTTWSKLYNSFQRLQGVGAISLREHPNQFYSIKLNSKLFYKGVL